MIDDAALSLLILAARFVQNLCAMLLLGAASFNLYMRDIAEARRGFGTLVFMAALALAASVASLCLTLADIGRGLDSLADPAQWRAFIFETSLGPILIGRLILIAAATASAFALEYRRENKKIVVLLCVFASASLITIPFTGHAGASASSAAVASEAVHLLAASIWVGGLLQLALWPLTVREAGRGDELKRALLRFSTIAQGALLVLLLGGFIVLGDIIGPARDVLQRNWGDFGLMLVIKLALIVAMIIFAALNRFVLLPRLPHDRTTLYRAIGAEALLGCFVILAATALAHSEPPHMHDPGHQTAMALYKGE